MLEKIEVGDKVAAEYGGHMLSAQVLDLADNKARVRLVDTGSEVWISKSRLRWLRD